MRTTYSEQLAGWLSSKERTPLIEYREPRRALTSRLAARVILGQDIDIYKADAEALLRALNAQPSGDGVIEWGNMAACQLLLSGSASEEARRCLADYEAVPAVGTVDALADRDDMALAVASFLGDRGLAEKARASRKGRDLPRPTAVSAELLFLLDEGGAGVPVGDGAVFSAVRGIQRTASVSVGRTPAAFVCAFAAVAQTRTRDALWATMGRYDQLSWGDDGTLFRLEPSALDAPVDEKTIRLELTVAGTGSLRCDVVESYELVENTVATFDGLKRNLDAPTRRRFDKLRRSADTTLELTLKVGPGLDVPQPGLDVLGRRVAAALELLGPRGYALRRVVARAESQ